MRDKKYGTLEPVIDNPDMIIFNKENRPLPLKVNKTAEVTKTDLEFYSKLRNYPQDENQISPKNLYMMDT